MEKKILYNTSLFMESVVPWQPKFAEMLIVISNFHFLPYLLHSVVVVVSFLQHYPFNSFDYVLVGYGGFLGSWPKREFQDNLTEDGNHAVTARSRNNVVFTRLFVSRDC